jgi:hypothetical protein
VVGPFADFMTRPQWLAILLFVVLYKFGDALAGVMATPFYVATGFTRIEVANISKVFGVFATLAGVGAGGLVVLRLGHYRSLLACGIAQMLSNLMYVLQAFVGNDAWLLAATIGIENFTGGMGSAAFVAYLSGLCNVAFTATQYALLSSLASVGRTNLSAWGGWLASELGWPLFFAVSTAAGAARAADGVVADAPRRGRRRRPAAPRARRRLMAQPGLSTPAPFHHRALSRPAGAARTVRSAPQRLLRARQARQGHPLAPHHRRAGGGKRVQPRPAQEHRLPADRGGGRLRLLPRRRLPADLGRLPAARPADPHRVVRRRARAAVSRQRRRITHDYQTFFGGVVLFATADFRRINGYSNDYWGWGFEDNDAAERCRIEGLAIGFRDGTFEALHHQNAGFDRGGRATPEHTRNAALHAQKKAAMARRARTATTASRARTSSCANAIKRATPPAIRSPLSRALSWRCEAPGTSAARH